MRRLGYSTEQRLHEKGLIFRFNFTFNPDTPFGIKEEPGSGKEGTVKAKEVDFPCAAPPPAVLSRCVISCDWTAKKSQKPASGSTSTRLHQQQERRIRLGHVSPPQHSRGEVGLAGKIGRSARMAGKTIKRQQKKRKQGG